MTATAPAACVVGWPIGHSRSPLIFNYWLKTYGIAGEYRREAVPPEEFRDFIGSLKARGYVGANVTVPHKEAALACSTPDDRARAVGAANTLWLDGAALRSTNTDAEGFLDNLDASAPQWDSGLSTAGVLGAGGAAARPVDERDAPGAALDQAVDHAARRATGAEHQHPRAFQGDPALERSNDGTDIGVESEEATIRSAHDRVAGPNTGGEVIHTRQRRQDLLFQRHGYSESS